MYSTWRDLYASDLQGVYALWLVPALFLIHLGASRPDPARAAAPRDAPFIRAYALVFTLTSILDVLATGVLSPRLALSGGAATAVLVVFVLLGDFRVFLLLFYLSRGSRSAVAAAGEAAAWTLIVPIVSAAANAALTALAGELPGQTIWLLYEGAFVVLALVLSGRVLPARADGRLLGYLRAVVTYVIVYYALWVAADVAILQGADVGWALRILPNQLYYGFYTPFIHRRFLSRRYASASAAAQASR